MSCQKLWSKTTFKTVQTRKISTVSWQVIPHSYCSTGTEETSLYWWLRFLLSQRNLKKSDKSSKWKFELIAVQGHPRSSTLIPIESAWLRAAQMIVQPKNYTILQLESSSGNIPSWSWPNQSSCDWPSISAIFFSDSFSMIFWSHWIFDTSATFSASEAVNSFITHSMETKHHLMSQSQTARHQTDCSAVIWAHHWSWAGMD